MDKQQFDELTRKMDILIRLTAINSVTGKSLSEQVSTLASLGFKPSEIATILVKPLNIITATQSYLQKKKWSGS